MPTSMLLDGAVQCSSTHCVADGQLPVARQPPDILQRQRQCDLENHAPPAKA